MEKNIFFNSFKSTFSGQLLKAKNHVAMKHYSAAINIYSMLIEQLHQEALTVDGKYKIEIPDALMLCHVLRQNSCFTWLIEDIASFNQNKVQYVEEFLNDCKIILIQNTLYHPGENKHSIYLKKFIVHILFAESCSINFLKRMQQKLCNLHDKFELVEDTINQSLTILGLALINAYENQPTTFQGLKIAVNMNSSLVLLIQAIRFQLPVLMCQTIDEVVYLLNPLYKFRSTAGTITHSNLKPG